MLRNSYIYIFFFVFIIIFGQSCESDNKKEQDEREDSLAKIEKSQQPTIVKVENRLFSLPSPFQISMLLRQSGTQYNKELLNPTTNQTRYITNFKQALNLGVYGADLGYVNVYEQYPDAAIYFATIKILSKELGINSFFDEATLERIERNENNRDSLLHITSNLYRNADAFLLNNSRNEVAVLILAGGWVEGTYLLTQIAKQIDNQELINRIGEQKYPLDNLIEILSPYYGRYTEEFDQLLRDLIELASVFDGVVIKYTYEPPTVNPENKLTIINSNSKTIINEYQLETITKKIAKIRSDVVE